MRQVGLESTKLAANVAKITILAASLATCAQLGAFLAALFRQRQNDDPTWRISGSAVLAALTW